MSTLFHSHSTCVWGDFPKGLGTIVWAIKPFVEACQVGGECINHLHYISNVRHSFSPFSIAWGSLYPFFVPLAFDSCHSLMPKAYDNSVWCVLEFHNDGRNVDFSDLFVILEVISL